MTSKTTDSFRLFFDYPNFGFREKFFLLQFVVMTVQRLLWCCYSTAWTLFWLFSWSKKLGFNLVLRKTEVFSHNVFVLKVLIPVFLDESKWRILAQFFSVFPLFLSLILFFSPISVFSWFINFVVRETTWNWESWKRRYLTY